MMQRLLPCVAAGVLALAAIDAFLASRLGQARGATLPGAGDPR